MPTLPRLKGISLLAVVAATAILGVLSTGLPILLATNQAARTAQLQMGQAYFSARAALEFSMRQIKIDGDPWPIPTRYLLSNAFVTNRTTNKIWVTGTSGNANSSFSITDPNPPTQQQCLTIDTSASNIISSQKKLTGITLQRKSNCQVTLSIVSLTISWSPDGGQKIFQIQISAQGVDYNNPPKGSGTTFVLNSPYTISDGSSIAVQFIKWRNSDDVSTLTSMTIVFNFSDGSSKSVTFSPTMS